MPLLNEPQLNAVASSIPLVKSFLDRHRDELKKADPNTRYDIFLSHRFLDAEHVKALKFLLNEAGYSVFVDWEEEPERDRAQVTSATAAWLKDAIDRSTALLYAASTNSIASKWMPWELGYADGKLGKVALIPIAKAAVDDDSFEGQEYLGLYPYITYNTYHFFPDRYNFWLRSSEHNYVVLRDWLDNK